MYIFIFIVNIHHQFNKDLLHVSYGQCASHSNCHLPVTPQLTACCLCVWNVLFFHIYSVNSSSFKPTVSINSSAKIYSPFYGPLWRLRRQRICWQCRRPTFGISPGERHGNPPQYSCLENPMDRGAWWATVHGVAKNQTRLSNQHFHFRSHLGRLGHLLFCATINITLLISVHQKR